MCYSQVFTVYIVKNESVNIFFDKYQYINVWEAISQQAFCMSAAYRDLWFVKNIVKYQIMIIYYYYDVCMNNDSTVLGVNLCLY